MEGDETTNIDLAELFPSWFWMVGIGLVIGTAALLALWYLKHPDRSPFQDFAKRTIDIPATNGSIPSQTPTVGNQTVESTVESTEAPQN